jgi:hypothetical protein
VKGGNLTTEKREKTIDLGTEEAIQSYPNEEWPGPASGHKLSPEKFVHFGLTAYIAQAHTHCEFVGLQEVADVARRYLRAPLNLVGLRKDPP